MIKVFKVPCINLSVRRRKTNGMCELDVAVVVVKYRKKNDTKRNEL